MDKEIEKEKAIQKYLDKVKNAKTNEEINSAVEEYTKTLEPRKKPLKRKEKPKESLTKEAVSDAKHNDISPKDLKAQKQFILDIIDDALANPEKYGEKILLDVPGDGTFQIHNNEKALKQFRKDIVRKWPTKTEPYKPVIKSKAKDAKVTQADYDRYMKEMKSKGNQTARS